MRPAIRSGIRRKAFTIAPRRMPARRCCWRKRARLRSAVGSLQRALALVDRDMPLRVYEAMGVGRRGAVGSRTRRLPPRRISGCTPHWRPKDDTRSREVLAALHHYSGLPLLLRDHIGLRPWPPTCRWRADADAGHQAGRQRQVAASRRDHRPPRQKHGADPTLVFNRALLGGWLADERGAGGRPARLRPARRAVGRCGRSRSDRPTARPRAKETRLDSVVQVYAIRDLDALAERLLSATAVHRRLKSTRPHLPRAISRGRGMHSCCSIGRCRNPAPTSREPTCRGSPASSPSSAGKPIAPNGWSSPSTKGRPSTARSPRSERSPATALGEMTEEKVVGTMSPTEQALNWRWYLPRDTPPEARRRLAAEERHAAIVERWPTLPQPALAGKSPREAAGDPQLRIPLMAAVLILEQAGNTDRDSEAIADCAASWLCRSRRQSNWRRMSPIAFRWCAFLVEPRKRHRRRPRATLSARRHGRRPGGHRAVGPGGDTPSVDRGPHPACRRLPPTDRRRATIPSARWR